MWTIVDMAKGSRKKSSFSGAAAKAFEADKNWMQWYMGKVGHYLLQPIFMARDEALYLDIQNSEDIRII